MFEDIKNYFHLDNTDKTCQLCNQPLKMYTKCDGCQKFFCLSLRPMFHNGEWFCPLCKKNFETYLEPLRQSNIQDFFKKIF